jgi:hypothetical protein
MHLQTKVTSAAVTHLYKSASLLQKDIEKDVTGKVLFS